MATRCRRGEATSGDLAVVSLLPDGALVAGIDGLGHGAEAARARAAPPTWSAAAGTMTSSASSSAATSALRGTRGAAISLAFVSLRHSGMTWLGVGNVEGRVLSGDRFGPGPKGSLALSRGVPGHELPVVRVASLDVRPGDVLLLRPTASTPAFADALEPSGSPQAISERILRAHWKPSDDAVVRRGPLPRRGS
jgi:negative regulator of sigma-B (phosphoserine phosphatase)